MQPLLRLRCCCIDRQCNSGDVAVQQRLGIVDAAAVDLRTIQQFFLYCVLHGACVWPAVVLHAAFNAIAVATEAAA